jgi:tetratricopeptide (TPR) repeat protein
MRLLVIFLLISQVFHAQKGDSTLQNILAIANDTEKVNLLYQRGFGLRNQDPQLALEYAEHAEKAARGSKSQKHLAKSFNLLGILYYRKADYAKALNYHQQALRLREDIKDVQGAGFSHTNIGNIYSELRFYEKAEWEYLRALEAAQSQNDEKNVAKCLINLGVLNQTLHELTAAQEHYAMALKIAEKLNDYEIQSLCLNNIAQVHFDKGDYEQSIAVNHDALKLRDMMEDEVEMADSYLNLASNHIRLKDISKAKEFLDSGYAIASRNAYFEALQIARNIYSEYYSAKNEYENAYRWLNRYNQSRDSMAEVQAGNMGNYSLAGLDFESGSEPEVPIKNMWLFISVLIFLILVPLSLVRFKR